MSEEISNQPPAAQKKINQNSNELGENEKALQVEIVTKKEPEVRSPYDGGYQDGWKTKAVLV